MTALFVALDGYGDPTIWRRDSDDDRLPQPILSRTAANARGFEELAALVEGADRSGDLRGALLGWTIEWAGETADLDDCREIADYLAPRVTRWIGGAA